MKKTIAKFLSVILVIVMMTGTLPAGQAVFAAEEETATETETKNDECDNDKSGDEDKKPAETVETKPTESKTEEPSETKTDESEPSESQKAAETEETVPEVESEKEPVSTVKRKASNAVISEASCTIKTPKAGDYPWKNINDYMPQNDEHSKYVAQFWRWCDKYYEVLMEDDDVFEAGKTYYAIVLFDTQSGYDFTEQTVFKVNGKTPTKVEFKSSFGYFVYVPFVASDPLSVSLKFQTLTENGMSYNPGSIGGKASLDKDSAIEGETVEIIGIEPNSGFYLKRIQWYDDDTPKTDITTEKKFTVGKSNPTVIVTFQEDPTKYKISTNTCSNGTVTLSKTEAKSFEIVEVSATPDSGYYVEKISWRKQGELLTENDITELSFFLMPRYNVSISVVFKPVEKNTLSVKPKTAKVKYKKLKKKAQTVACSSVLTVSNPQGKVTYKLTGVKRGKSKKYKKYFKINATTGNVTVKKKLKKGTYKITCQVTAAGTKKFTSAASTVTFKIKVK